MPLPGADVVPGDEHYLQGSRAGLTDLALELLATRFVRVALRGPPAYAPLLAPDGTRAREPRATFAPDFEGNLSRGIFAIGVGALGLFIVFRPSLDVPRPGHRRFLRDGPGAGGLRAVTGACVHAATRQGREQGQHHGQRKRRLHAQHSTLLVSKRPLLGRTPAPREPSISFHDK